MEESKQNPLALTVAGMMRELGRVLKKRTAEQLDTKLTMEQIGLLMAISCSREEVIQQDMACSMGKDKSAILRTIDLIEAKELIKRVSDTTDRRKKYLMVTKKGERVVEQYLQIDHVLTAELQNEISKEEIDTFYKVLNLIKMNAKQI
jgi:MarR family transcriptional regulator, transcriptional regulator for hemolysin